MNYGWSITRYPKAYISPVSLIILKVFISLLFYSPFIIFLIPSGDIT